MKDIHKIFTEFKEEFPEVYEKHAGLGKEVHMESGPLDGRTRWLIKIAISGGSRHHRALETHIKKARKSGAAEQEIKQVILMLMTTGAALRKTV
ncbi:MAG: carboxymuconolactone decarboxylase family protein [Elusimicrobiota bacterium]|nr:carboxymuconolactone decarboxylase family protein [Elusimicrobiota bacterium]